MFLPDEVGEHAHACGAYHEPDEAARSGTSRRATGVRCHSLSLSGIAVREGMSIVAVKEKGQRSENQEAPMKAVELQPVAKFRYIRFLHIASAKEYPRLCRPASVRIVPGSRPQFCRWG